MEWPRLPLHSSLRSNGVDGDGDGDGDDDGDGDGDDSCAVAGTVDGGHDCDSKENGHETLPGCPSTFPAQPLAAATRSQVRPPAQLGPRVSELRGTDSPVSASPAACLCTARVAVQSHHAVRRPARGAVSLCVRRPYNSRQTNSSWSCPCESLWTRRVASGVSDESRSLLPSARYHVSARPARSPCNCRPARTA